MADELRIIPSYDTRLRTEEYEEGSRGGRGGEDFLVFY
jgi:hypothetical protein